MTGRVVRWLAWGLVLSLVPLLAAYVLRLAKSGETSVGPVFAMGQGFLISVSWLGAGLRELRTTPLSRSRLREALTWSGFVMAFLVAAAYGFLTEALLAGDDLQITDVQLALVSVITLGVSALTCSAAVAVGTPGEEA